MIITKNEKRSSATLREKESQKDRGFQAEKTVDRGASKHVASDKLYLTDVEETTPFAMQLANRTSITAT